MNVSTEMHMQYNSYIITLNVLSTMTSEYFVRMFVWVGDQLLTWIGEFFDEMAMCSGFTVIVADCVYRILTENQKYDSCFIRMLS